MELIQFSNECKVSPDENVTCSYDLRKCSAVKLLNNTNPTITTMTSGLNISNLNKRNISFLNQKTMHETQFSNCYHV